MQLMRYTLIYIPSQDPFAENVNVHTDDSVQQDGLIHVR